MAPITQASDESNHQALLDKLDVYSVPKPFRNPHWRVAQRRNKTVKQIVTELSRKDASVMVTQSNSGIGTPVQLNSAGDLDVHGPDFRTQPNIAHAAQSLSSLAIERSRNGGGPAGPVATYTNIESAPSLHPSSRKHYCDITGLSAPYSDPKTRLRYHNREIFGVIRTLTQHATEEYLAARGAHTVLK